MKKKIFITGVSSGIGNYLAKNLVDKYQIYGASRNSSQINGLNFFSCDLRDDDQIMRLATMLSKENIDIFVFNAGIGYFGDFGSITLEQEKEMLQVNLRSNMIFIKQLLPLISKKTQFIFVGSIAGKSLFSGGVGYQTSKFALRGFVGSLRKELGNCIFLINPKIVETNFHKNSLPKGIRSAQIVFDEYKKTDLKDILSVVENIIDGKQEQWEIDI